MSQFWEKRLKEKAGNMFLREKKLENYFTLQKDTEFALIFGSATLNQDTPMSDIDIAVYFQGRGILQI